MRSNFIFNLIFVLALGLSIEACKGTDDLSNSTSGSTTTTFAKSSALTFTRSSTAKELLFGKFTTDSYPDMVLVSNLGADYYPNASSGAAWGTRVNLSAVGFTSGYAVNLSNSGDSNNLTDLILSDGTSLYTLMNSGVSGGFASSSLSSSFALTATPQSVSHVSTATQGTGFVIVGSSASQQSWVSVSNGTLGSETAASGSNGGLLESGIKVFSGDVNGDGKVDFVLIPSTGASPIEVWLNSADTSFTLTTPITPASTHSIHAAELVDLNADNKLDIVLATDSSLELYLNSTTTGSGTITFTESTALSSFSGDFSALVVADFTGDGKKDIFAAKTSSTGILLSKSGTLTFRDTTSSTFTTANTPPSSAIKVYGVDLNQDGKVDLIHLNSDGTITVHLNTGS